MTATVAPPGPPPPNHPHAQWNGEQYFDLIGNAWVPVTDPITTAPPLPAPGSNANVAASGKPPAVAGDDEEKIEIEEGTYGDYFDQPSGGGGGGPTWKFHKKPDGTTYRGIVAEDLPIRVTRQNRGQNGQTAWQLWVPMLMMPEDDYRDGRAQAVFKSDSRDKLTAAMAAVGAPVTVDPKTGKEGYVPKPGAFIQMTKIGEQAGSNPKTGDQWTKYLYEVHYRNADDPNIQQIKAEILEAIAAVEEAPPPPKMKWNGKEWVVDTSATTAATTPAVTAPAPPPPGSSTPATNRSVPAAAATPVTPPPPANTPAPGPAATTPAAAPPLPPPLPSATSPEALQAAAARVATSDQPPAATPPANGATPAVQITDEQWAQIPEAARQIVADRAGVPIPPHRDPANKGQPIYLG